MNTNVICWFEIYTDNMERAKSFYSEVLKIRFQDGDAMGDDLKMSFFSSPENQGVSGALVEMNGTRPADNGRNSTIVYFPCEDCSVEESRVEKAGGKVLVPKMSLGDFGFCSLCTDNEGNSFGLKSMA